MYTRRQPVIRRTPRAKYHNPTQESHTGHNDFLSIPSHRVNQSRSDTCLHTVCICIYVCTIKLRGKAGREREKGRRWNYFLAPLTAAESDGESRDNALLLISFARGAEKI